MQFPNNPKRDPSDKTEPPQPNWRKWLWPAVIGLLLLWTLVRLPDVLQGMTGGGQTVEVPYSFFYQQIEADNVAEVLLQDMQATGRFRSPVSLPPSLTGSTSAEPVTFTNFVTTLLPVEDSTLAPTLREHNVIILAERIEPSPLLVFLINFGPLLLILGFFIWSARRTQSQMSGVFGFGRTRARE
jgi:cell division protease FtsH